jgi:hypothetical protein
MIPLKKYLEDRISQLESRKIMIPRYLKRPGEFAGKKDFSLDDIPKIEEDIRLCKLALRAITTKKQNT